MARTPVGDWEPSFEKVDHSRFSMSREAVLGPKSSVDVGASKRKSGELASPEPKLGLELTEAVCPVGPPREVVFLGEVSCCQRNGDLLFSEITSARVSNL